MKQHGIHRGFTVVELIIVTVVLAVVISISVFAFGTWRQRTAKTEVKTALSAVVAAMNDARNFNNVYPTSIPSNANVSNRVTVTYMSGNTTSYCVEGVSISDSTVRMYVSNTSTTPQLGTC